MQIEAVSTEPGSIDLIFTPSAIFTQGAGVIQGGAVSAMLDLAMGFAGMAHLPEHQFGATTNLEVAFLRAALPGSFKARGWVDRASRHLVFTRGEIRDAASNMLIATGSSALLVREGG